MKSKKKPASEDISNGSRVLWTFLGYTLVGPLLGGLYVAGAMVLAPPLGLAPLLPKTLPDVGSAALATFVWSAVPSALCALMLMPFVVRQGTIGWIEAVVAGVVAFAIAAVVTGPLPGSLPSLAFMAGLISLGVRQVLLNGNILRDVE